MHNLLSSASAVVLLSEYESAGLTAMEAAAAGRPVLVSDTSGLREVARRGWASAVAPTASPAMVAESLRGLIGHDPIEAPTDLPTWDTTTTALLSLYESILGTIPPKRHDRIASKPYPTPKNRCRP
jgi:glycosyltransferase involved in cell wall biosynthesis